LKKEAALLAFVLFSAILFAQDERIPPNYIPLLPDSNYCNHIFNNKIDFLNATFANDANFSQATFNYHHDDSVDVEFKRTFFLKDANFHRATFFNSSDVCFGAATFGGLARFDSVNFTGYAGFWYANFNSTADFQHVNFTHKDGVDFESANFNKNADFSEAKMRNASFNSASFSGAIIFDNAQFLSYAGFRSISNTLTNKTDISFRNAQLPDTLDFSDNRIIPTVIDLSIANFDSFPENSDRKINIFLYRSDIAKFHFDYLHFRLLFIDPTIKNSLCSDECCALYEQVLKNFKDRGQTASYEKLDIEYRDYQRSLFWWLSKAWWNYGYSKGRVFVWTLALILLFAMINYLSSNYLNKEVYSLPNIPTSPISHAFRFWYSLVYIVIIFFSFSLKPDKINFQKIGGVFYLFFIYISGLICLAYMANFVLQK
jgi:uncharacterized protein YjbI with pentapeptide repeats